MTPDMPGLMAALPFVMAAPADNAPVRQLCFRPDRHARSFPDQLALTRAAGIPGDRWLAEPWLRLPDGAPDPDIQVSILPARVLDLIWKPGDTAPHPGDPIIADMDLSLANLPPGTLVQAGSAVLRVSALFNDGCVKWKARYGADAKDWITAPGHPALRLRGILCAVVQDGAVRIGDRLQKLP
jgi:hypothetical protein